MFITPEEQSVITALDGDLDLAFLEGADSVSGAEVVQPMPGYDLAGDVAGATPSNQKPLVRDSFRLALLALLRWGPTALAVSEAQLGAATTSSVHPTFVDIANSTDALFLSPVERSYLVTVDLSAYVQAAPGGFPTSGFFRLKHVESGNVYGPAKAGTDWNVISTILPFTFRCLVPMSIGINTLRLVWCTNAGTTVLATNANCHRTITVQR